MSADHGVWYGLTFFLAFVGGILIFEGLRNRAKRRAWELANPIVSGSGERFLERLSELRLPTLLLRASAGRPFSKLGGDPELPSDVEWPSLATARRKFLGQFDLAEIHRHAPLPWLPPGGRLYAFFDTEGYGAADLVTVLYSSASSEPVRPPAGAAEGRPERRVEFSPFVSFPSQEWLDHNERLDLNFEELEARLEALGERPPEDGPLQRIGGYPDELQNGCLRLECEYLARGLPDHEYKSPAPEAVELASEEWRLLLQIDSDDELGFEFGDAGRLYVFIREKDALAADFSRTVTLFQCY